jgi:hypothetical protein
MARDFQFALFLFALKAGKKNHPGFKGKAPRHLRIHPHKCGQRLSELPLGQVTGLFMIVSAKHQHCHV